MLTELLDKIAAILAPRFMTTGTDMSGLYFPAAIWKPDTGL